MAVAAGAGGVVCVNRRSAQRTNKRLLMGKMAGVSEDDRALARASELCSGAIAPRVRSVRVERWRGGAAGNEQQGGQQRPLLSTADGGRSAERDQLCVIPQAQLSVEEAAVVYERADAEFRRQAEVEGENCEVDWRLAPPARPTGWWTRAHEPYPLDAHGALTSAVCDACLQPVVSAATWVPCGGVAAATVTTAGHLIRFHEGVRLSAAERDLITIKYKKDLPRRYGDVTLALADDAWRTDGPYVDERRLFAYHAANPAEDHGVSPIITAADAVQVDAVHTVVT